jgi:hypothetical protein
MWSPEVVREIARLAVPGASLCDVDRGRAWLAGAGFRVERREAVGAGARLVGTRDGEPARRRLPRRALVVGGGLAASSRPIAWRHADGTSTWSSPASAALTPAWASSARWPTCATR